MRTRITVGLATAAVLVLLLTACNPYKKENISPDNATYVRLINIDVSDAKLNTSGGIIFTYNGLIDGATLDSNTFTTRYGTGNLIGFYRPNGLMELTSYAGNFGFPPDPRFGFNIGNSRSNIDLSLTIPANAGIYRYALNNTLPSGIFTNTNNGLDPTGYFPNVSNRVPVAPIINGISFHKWAALPGGLASLRFDRATTVLQPTTDQGYINQLITGANLLQDQRPLVQGQVNTLIFGQKNNQKIVMALPEPTTEAFKPGFAYLRFANVTDPASAGSTDISNASLSVDVYLVKERALPTDSAQPEVLISQNLKPFVSPTTLAELPYMGIDMNPYIQQPITDSAGVHLPAYQARFYITGQSAANGNPPISIVELNRFQRNQFDANYNPSKTAPSLYLPYNPLLSWNNGGYVPLIRTFLFKLYQVYAQGDPPTPSPFTVDGQSVLAGVNLLSYDLEPAAVTEYFYH